MKHKPKLKIIISIVVFVLLAGLLAYYLKNHLSDFEQIALINPLWLIPLILLFLLSYIFIAIQTKVLLEPLGVKLKKLEVYMLSVVTGFYNLITPARGGMGVRAVYLKKKHNFSYTNFLSSLAGMYVVTFFIGSLFGLISLLLIYKLYNSFNLLILFIFLGLLIPLSLIIIFSPKFRESKNKFLNKIIQVANGWNLIRKNKKIILISLLFTSFSLIISAIIQLLSYHIFGVNISFIQGLFLACIGSISILIQLTPGNLGVAEAIAVFSALILGITPAQSLSVAILGRIVQMISMFTLGPIFSIILLKHKPKSENAQKS